MNGEGRENQGGFGGSGWGVSEAIIDKIAEKAAERALEKVYADVGEAVLKRAAWVVGVGVVAFLVWLKGGHFLGELLKGD